MISSSFSSVGPSARSISRAHQGNPELSHVPNPPTIFYATHRHPAAPLSSHSFLFPLPALLPLILVSSRNLLTVVISLLMFLLLLARDVHLARTLHRPWILIVSFGGLPVIEWVVLWTLVNYEFGHSEIFVIELWIKQKSNSAYPHLELSILHTFLKLIVNRNIEDQDRLRLRSHH